MWRFWSLFVTLKEIKAKNTISRASPHKTIFRSWLQMVGRPGLWFTISKFQTWFHWSISSITYTSNPHRETEVGKLIKPVCMLLEMVHVLTNSHLIPFTNSPSWVSRDPFLIISLALGNAMLGAYEEVW